MPDENGTNIPPTEGAPAPNGGTEPPQQPATEPSDPEDDLTKHKRQANHWQGEARKANRALADLQAELETLRFSQKSEHEQAIETARREGSTEAADIWKPRFETFARRAEAMRVMQKAGVTAPDLVLPHLSLDDVEVDENGQVDTESIEKALEAVLDTYPMLAGSNGSSQPIHHADLGAKARPAQATDLNSALRQALGGRPRR